MIQAVDNRDPIDDPVLVNKGKWVHVVLEGLHAEAQRVSSKEDVLIKACRTRQPAPWTPPCCPPSHACFHLLTPALLHEQELGAKLKTLAREVQKHEATKVKVDAVASKLGRTVSQLRVCLPKHAVEALRFEAQREEAAAAEEARLQQLEVEKRAERVPSGCRCADCRHDALLDQLRAYKALGAAVAAALSAFPVSLASPHSA